MEPSPVGRGSPEPSPEGRGEGEGSEPEADYPPTPPLDPNLLALARQLRREQTTAEGLLWALLRNRQVMGCKFRRQHPIAPYVLDFYCAEAHLGIELDGGQHNESEAQARDNDRTAFLAARGIKMIRFWNHEVLQETEAVLQQLWDALTKTLTPPSPSRARAPQPSAG